MNSFGQILAHWSPRREQPFALATVTHTEGSTYRKAGARMLVDASGLWVGMLSGGCLEQEVAQLAQRVIRQEKPAQVSFNTRRLFGCDGAIDLLIEPLLPGGRSALLPAAAECFARRTALAGTTLFDVQGYPSPAPGSYALMAEDGESFLYSGLPETLAGDARGIVTGPQDAAERSYTMGSCSLRALLQRVAPPLRLIVCGGGDDVVPLATLSAQLRWETHVVVHPSQEPPHLPPTCCCTVAAPEELTSLFKGDSRTFAVVMTHHYGRDLASLAALFSLTLPYIGLMGPVRRRERLLAELGERCDEFVPQNFACLHSPVGLDLGADGPEEVALSIIAEIQAVHRGRHGGFLKERREAIHAPSMNIVAS